MVELSSNDSTGNIYKVFYIIHTVTYFPYNNTVNIRHFRLFIYTFLLLKIKNSVVFSIQGRCLA